MVNNFTSNPNETKPNPAAARSSSYELLLHALNHEQTKDNYERHVLVLEKWSRESSNGLFICDLPSIVEVLEILQERLLARPAMFNPVLLSVIRNCSKPLLESKANERLRQVGVENIKSFYLQLSKLWENGSMHTRIACARCFRCIVNGGNDPTVLKADQVEWKQDGLTAQVTDVTFINALIRESGALNAMTLEFLRTVDDVIYEKAGFLKASATLSKLQSLKTMNQEDDSDDDISIAENNSFNNSNINNNNNNNNSKIMATYSRASFSTDAPVVVANETELTTQIESKRNELSAIQELSYILLSLCLELSGDYRNAAEMCCMHVCDGAVKLLRDAASDTPREPRVTICVEILWNCLESYLNQSQQNSNISTASLLSADVMNFEDAILTLKDVFLALLLDGYRLADKEVRNEVVVVLTLIGSFPEAIPYFLHSQLLNVLVTYSCAGEAGLSSWPFFSLPLAKLRNFSSAFDVDLQLKRELWMLVSDILQYDDTDVIMCVASSPLISVMLSYLEQNNFTPASVTMLTIHEEESTIASYPARAAISSSSMPEDRSRGSPGSRESYDRDAYSGKDSRQEGAMIGGGTAASGSGPTPPPPMQLKGLQVLAMKFLAQNAYRMMGEFMRVDGPIKILDVISKYGSAPNPENKSIIYHALLLLNRCLISSNTVKDKLEEQDAIRVFLHQFEDSDDEAIRAQAARLISIMCTESIESQTQLRKLNGVTSLVKTLTLYADARRPLVGRKAGIKLSENDLDLEDPTITTTGGEISILTIAVLDCVLNALVGNRKNEARFAQVEGIDALLDVLEVAPLLIRVQALRLLGDLLDNSRLVTFALAWRSAKTMRSAGQLLAHAWMDEEARLESERDNGVICNLWDPLGFHRWPIDNQIPTTAGKYLESLGSVSSFTSSTSQQIGQHSSAVTKLTSAISATRSGGVQNEVRNQMLKLDIRGIIANTLSLLGLLDVSNTELTSNNIDNINSTSNTIEQLRVNSMSDKQNSENDIDEIDDNWENPNSENISEVASLPGVVVDNISESLGPSDRQVISLAARYGILREGQWWNTIKEELHLEGVVPIDADAALVMERLELFFEAARTIQFEQMELVAVAQQLKHAKEQVFIGHIIQQKNQEIKSEWLKRKAQHNKVTSTKVKLK